MKLFLAGSNWGQHSVAVESRKCRRIQLCTCLWVLPAQTAHLFGVRNAGAESLRFFEAKQIQSFATQIHSADSSTSADSFAET